MGIDGRPQGWRIIKFLFDVSAPAKTKNRALRRKKHIVALGFAAVGDGLVRLAMGAFALEKCQVTRVAWCELGCFCPHRGRRLLGFIQI